jgi:hypothetical protein
VPHITECASSLRHVLILLSVKYNATVNQSTKMEAPCRPQINKFGGEFGSQGGPMLVGTNVDTGGGDVIFGGSRSGVSTQKADLLLL